LLPNGIWVAVRGDKWSATTPNYSGTKRSRDRRPDGSPLRYRRAVSSAGTRARLWPHPPRRRHLPQTDLSHAFVRPRCLDLDATAYRSCELACRRPRHRSNHFNAPRASGGAAKGIPTLHVVDGTKHRPRFTLPHHHSGNRSVDSGESTPSSGMSPLHRRCGPRR